MHHARNDHPVDVSENFLEIFAFSGRSRSQRGKNLAWLDVLRNGALANFLAKIGNPVCELVHLPAKNFRRRVAGWLSILH